MEAMQPIPPCPLCKQADRARRVSEIAEDDPLAQRLPPPEAPDAPPPLVGMNEGLGCLGALFFGSAFILSFAFGSTVGIVIFGAFMLLFATSFTVLLGRHLAARRTLEAQMAAWDARVAVWERLLVCDRDQAVYDPETGEHRPIERQHELYT